MSDKISIDNLDPATYIPFLEEKLAEAIEHLTEADEAETTLRAEREALRDKMILLQAERDGLASTLIDVQRECIAGSNLLRIEQEKVTAISEENLRLRAALANSAGACVYCQLPADEMARCKAGFPGCSRMDDITGCPEFGAMMNEAALLEQITRLKAVISNIIEEANRPGGRDVHLRRVIAVQGKEVLDMLDPAHAKPDVQEDFL